PAIARARVETDIGNAQPAQHLCRYVAAPCRLGVRIPGNHIQSHVSPECLSTQLAAHDVAAAPVKWLFGPLNFCLHERQKKWNGRKLGIRYPTRIESRGHGKVACAVPPIIRIS